MDAISHREVGGEFDSSESQRRDMSGADSRLEYFFLSLSRERETGYDCREIQQW